MIDFRVTEDNTNRIMAALNIQIQAALEACGQQAVSHAKQNITAGVPRNPNSWYTPTGALRNSMTHQVKGKECHVGSNIEYAIYNEVGTGKYAEGGRGRKTPWMYKDAKGNVHKTSGMKPLHFLKKAIQDHMDEYKSIIKKHLAG